MESARSAHHRGQAPRRDPFGPTPRAPTRIAAATAADTCDAQAADAARRCLREEGIPEIAPDDRVGTLLAAGEHLVAVRRGVEVERRDTSRRPGVALSGDLYVTTSRLVHVGEETVEIALDDIHEAVVGPRTLRLVVGCGRSVDIRVEDPRVLRVEIAAVREAARDARPEESRVTSGSSRPSA